MELQDINNFLYASSKKLPDIINPVLEVKELREVYEDVALFVFNVEDPMTIQELTDIFDETFGIVIVYHHMRSKETDFAQSVCAIQSPGSGPMIKINASTNSLGKITRVDIRLFDSLERFGVETRKDLQRMTNFPGEFYYSLTEVELMTHFL